MKLNFTSNLTAADSERRVIAGRIVTWNEVGHTSQGPTRFAKNSITVDDDVKLLREHDRSTPLGRATRITELEDGIEASFRVAGTTAGSDALVEAAEQLRDGLSVGVEVLESEYDADGTLIVTASRLDEVSLVHTPALSSARVDRVAASQASTEADTEEGEQMNPDENAVEVEEVEAEVVEASRPVPAVRSRVSFSSPAEYLATYVRAQRGDVHARGVITAALADQTISDNPGIVPTPIVGNLIEKEYGARPLKNSARNLPMPMAGASFIRPLVVTHTTVGKQANELAQLASQDMSIDPVTVTKDTYGGALRLSRQDIDWSDPSILGIVMSDLVRQYAEQTEAALGAALVAGATGTGTLANNATSGVFTQAIYSASAAVHQASGRLADTLWASPDEWARLGGLSDGSGRPLFPTLGPANAGGTSSADSFQMNPFGLRMVVSSHLPTGTLIVGNSSYFEVFENVGGALRADQVDVLGVTIAYYGYLASLVTMGGAFVKLTPTGTK